MRGYVMAAGLILATPALLRGQMSAEKAVLVTPDNFNRAESDMYFAETINLAGGTGKFHHYRDRRITPSVNTSRLVVTNSGALVPDYTPKITTLTSRSPSLEHCRQRFASN
jgi:hypothetical protein